MFIHVFIRKRMMENDVEPEIYHVRHTAMKKVAAAKLKMMYESHTTTLSHESRHDQGQTHQGRAVCSVSGNECALSVK